MLQPNTKTYTICGLIILVGTLLSIGFYASLKDSNELRRDKAISNIYSHIHSNIQREIERNLNSLYALRANYLAHKNWTREEFSSYASYYTSNIKSIQALEWVPAVSLAHRDSFELAAQKNGFDSFKIFKRSGDKIVSAERRDIYYPVYFIEPFQGNEAALGFDPGPNTPRQVTLDKAILSNQAAATEIMTIIQKKDPHKAVLVFVPIHDPVSLEVLGLVEGVYLVDQLINSALIDLHLPQEVNFNLSTDTNSKDFVFSKKTFDDNPSEIRKGEIVMADRTWHLEVLFKNDQSFSNLTPILFLLVSLMLTFLIVKVVYDTLTDNSKELKRYVLELERKNHDLEQYAYVASHDLQEPLHSLQGLVQLVHDDYNEKLDELGKTYLTHIRESSLRMGRLITNLLHYSRLGQNIKKPKQVDCNRLLKTVLESIKPMIQSTKSDVIITTDLPKVLAYPELLKQLFEHLISNAIKFQSEGTSPKIEISAERKNDIWEFSIKDNGIGISVESNDRIFTIFRRLHSRSVYSGTGIGLAFCKKIVDLHQGQIWMESKLGKGSTFFFTLNLT